MKQRYKLVRNIFFIAILLTIVEVVFLVIEPDLKHIILTSIVGVCLALLFAFFIILKLEVNQIIFEYDKDGFVIRLVNYDDYQNVRVLLNDTPLTNSKEEVTLLKEYDEITTDMVRTRFHYIAFLDNQPIGIIYAHDKNSIVEIKGCKDSASLENIITVLAEAHKVKATIKK